MYRSSSTVTSLERSLPHVTDSQPDDVRATSPHLSRRALLALGAAGVGALAARRLVGQGGAARTPAGLVIRNARALDAETPIAALAAPITAPEHFFVRSHFGPPAQLPLAWTLTIDGRVGRPATFSLDEIRSLGTRAGAKPRAVTIECAGNGRGVFMLPKTSGVQWERGAVSTATWTGVPLRALLERVDLKMDGRHLWMEALDHAAAPAVPKFLRSIPRDVALGDAFVAYEMNGRPIPLLHGGPLRLIVPRRNG
jgi:sulfite oxidase